MGNDRSQWSQHNVWRHHNLRCSRAVNSVANGWMWPKIKLIQPFMGVLVTCKNEEDPFKNEDATVVTTDLPL